ncbi:MAG: Hpt domain-containing protein, partial [Moraxellaceae bacterium]
MGDNHSFLALDWVKGEIEETLKQARQALEAYVENPEDATRMRFCLAYLHQVHGTLQMVEFYGAALLAEEMEKLCLALINNQVARVADGQEVLMRAILQLPPYLERVKASRRDLPVVLLPLLNDLRAARGESLMSETALFTPDLAAGERAPIQVAPAAADPVLLKKIRQMYQVALLGVIRGENLPTNLGYMSQVFSRLEKLSGASPLRELWLVSAALVEGLTEKTVDLGTSVKMLLGQVDRQLRTVGEDGQRRAPTELLKNLLYYVAKSSGSTPRLRAVKDLYRLDDALPGDALVSEERARMSGPDREAMKSVVDALCEELARAKDTLDLFVRSAERKPSELGTLVPVLKQVADTVAVLGLGQPRRILQEQIEAIDAITSSGIAPQDGPLLDIAGALLYVEATLMGMVAEKPMGQPAASAASEFSAQDQLSDAQAAVLRESRSALEKAKDAVIEYIASQWNPVHLEAIPGLVGTVRGGLAILNLQRPAELLGKAGRYVSEKLLAGQHRPDWQEMDTLADVITSVEYFLERIANDTHGGDSILDIAERGLAKLGVDKMPADAPAAEDEDEESLPDAGEWSDADAAAFEAELASAEAVTEAEIPAETDESQVLLSVGEPVASEEEIGFAPALGEDELSISLDEPDHGAALAAIHDSTVLDEADADLAPFVDDVLLQEDAAPAVADAVELQLEDMPAAHVATGVGVDVSNVADESVGISDVDTGDAEAGESAAVDADGLPAAEPHDEDPFAALEAESAFVAPAEPELAVPAQSVAVEPPSAVQAAPEQPAVAEAPKKPLLPVLTQMPEDDHSFDEEIREIFVEEAEEVMETINEYFPKWAANFDDTASLLEFRRGFHTLKGSGRMVGAKVVGELAWAFENMLNKVRDKILPPDQVMVSLISECLSVIPGLVEDFNNRAAPRINTSPLMAAAEAISSGKAVTALDVAEAAARAHGEDAGEPAGSPDEFDALAASLAPVVENESAALSDTPVEAGVNESDAGEPADDGFFADAFAETVVTEVADLPSAAEAESHDLERLVSDEHSCVEVVENPAQDVDVVSAEPPAVEATDDVPATAESEIDPVLLEIFTSEADTHLAEISSYLESVDPVRSGTVISDELIRSLHTLKGSAGMAGITQVADIAAPLEHLFKDLRNQGSKAGQDHVAVLRDGHALINQGLRQLAEGGSADVAGAESLIDHIRRLDHERMALLDREQAEQLGEGVAPAVTSAGLVSRFMELGLDHVLDAPWELDGWLNGAASAEKIHALQDELLQLSAASATTDVVPLTTLTDRLASVYKRLAQHELVLDNEVMNDLSAAHDEIINVFDTLAACQTVQANDTVLARLVDLLEMPAIAQAPLSDEPATVAFEPEERSSLAERMTDAGEADWEAPADLLPAESIDPELLEIFLEEADEVLEAAEAELDNWRREPANTAPLAALQRQLHTLKGGARLAEIRALGDLSHELEFLYEGLVDGRYEAVPELTGLLQRCHDRLAEMVAELRSRGVCPSGIDLVNAINAFRRDPSAGIPSAETAQVASEAAAPVVETVESAAQPVSEEAEHITQAAVESAGEEVAVTETADDHDAIAPAAESPDQVFAEFFPESTPAAAVAPAASVAAESEPQPELAVAPAAAPAPVIAAQDFDPELLEIFLEEAGEIVDETSEQLASWRNDTHNTLPVQQLQRGLHTLKGGARMAEIAPLGDLAHHMENLYEAVCDGRMSATEPLFGLLNRCHDRLAQAVELLRGGSGCPDTADLIRQIERYSADPENFQDVPDVVTLTPVAAPEPEPAPVPAPREPMAPLTIEAAPVPENVDSDILDIFLEESEELAEGIESSLAEWLENREASAPMEALMRHLHTLKGGARLAGLKELGDLAHDWENDLVAIQNGVRTADDAFFAGLGARQEAVLARIKAVRAGSQAQTAAAPVAADDVASDMPSEVASPAPELPQPVAMPAPVVSAPTAVPAPAGVRAQPPSMLGGFRKDAGARGPQEMIRVPSDLLEKLVNLAGETSITRSRVEMGVHGFAQTVEEMGATIQRLADQLRRMDAEMETQIVARHNEETGGKYEDFDPLEMDQYSSLNQLSKALAESASDLLDLKSTLLDKARDTETLLLQQSRINTELQEGLMRSRMVPFSRLVPRLKRIVRQTGQEVGKPADLDVINPEGEMDRTLLERIVAPLEHMLRNAVDHGLEDAAGRAAAGKPAQGRVTLTLAREGGDVVLTLADDGRGINIPAVRKKALERGLISEGQEISDQDVIQFIFHAGFSTAAAVTQISGRGVGMDVVNSEIKQMGGVVSIASVTGKGTTFTIRLPFTVAVNRALMVRIGEDSYAIPLSQIEGIVRASPYELETYYGPEAPLFEYAGIAYKLSYLGEFVHGVKSPNLVGHTLPLPVLLIRGGDQHIAIQVDQLIGSREIVVKSVGAQLASVAGISGATILGDGSVVIILDVVAMLRAAAMVAPRVSVSVDSGAALPAAADTRRTRQVMVVDDSV